MLFAVKWFRLLSQQTERLLCRWLLLFPWLKNALSTIQELLFERSDSGLLQVPRCIVPPAIKLISTAIHEF